MLANSKNVLITGGTFHHIEGTELTPFQQLKQLVASNAFHNSDDEFDPPKCHPGTRVAVIDRIMAWIRTPEDSTEDKPPTSIMWLNGKAGAGKSAIARTIAEQCEAAGLLLASFFFSRSDATRNHGQPLIPTIAYQMTAVLPQLRPHLEENIARDPLIFKRSLEAQLSALIVAPMQHLSNLPTAFTIIIDGLDECNDIKTQGKILTAIANLIRQRHLRLRFLIASRPEPHITDVFNSFKLTDIHIDLELNHTFNPDLDIELFLRESFNEIKQTHRLRSTIPDPWPTPFSMYALVQKASGQFIYASVVKKYMQSARHPPASRLDVILGLCPSGSDDPFAELDVLYKHILRGLEDIETARMLLTFLCLSIPYLCFTSDISDFFGLQLPIVHVCVGDLSSLLDVTSYAGLAYRLSVTHASFSDFLFDPHRSEQFYIHQPTAHTMLAQQCLKNLTHYFSVGKKGNLDYSAKTLLYHCQLATMTQSLQLQIIQLSHCSFSKSPLPLFITHYLPKYLNWMENQSWEGGLDAYVRLSREYQETLQIIAQRYLAHPKTTLLLTIPVEIYMQPKAFLLPKDFTSLYAIWEDICNLNRELDCMDKCNMSLKFIIFAMSLKNSFPLHYQTIPILVGMLDRKTYSASVTKLMEYLCNRRKHQRDGWWCDPCKLKRRRNRPWMWHRMRKSGALREIKSADKQAPGAKLRRWCHKTSLPSRYFPPTRAIKYYISTRAYRLALRIFAHLLRRAIKAPGEYDPRLVPLARRCTFSVLAMKFPHLKRDAEAAIAELLASVGVSNR